MELYVGTSGYAYKPWKGPFYPADLPDKQMLPYYAERFRSVEINNTFYRMPKTSVVEAWAAEVPEGFRFVLKASQRITHIKRLKDCAEPVQFLVHAADALGPKLGALLFQTPPNLKLDLPRLEAFVALLPRDKRCAFEFRNASWFDEAVYALLRAHGAALALAESEAGLEVPFVATADWGYLRLRLPEYSDAELTQWIERVRGTGWREAYVYFKHEDEGKGPALAQRFLALAAGM